MNMDEKYISKYNTYKIATITDCIDNIKKII